VIAFRSREEFNSSRQVQTERRGDAGPVRLLLGGETHRPLFKSEIRNPKSERDNQTQISRIIADSLIEAEVFANVRLSLREICGIYV
jgi:hypothetical protein